MSSWERPDPRPQRFGVVADTHGLLRGDLLEALRGADGIIHAGDVGTPELLERLRRLAPVTAVRGNTDAGDAFSQLPRTEALQIGEVWVYVLHDLEHLDMDPAAGGFHVVISGHSHRPERQMKDGVLFLNPGSAGPRRFSLPVSMALLEVNGSRIETRFISLGS